MCVNRDNFAKFSKTLYISMISFVYPEPDPDSLWKWVDGSELNYTKWSQETEAGKQPSYCCPEDQPAYCGTIGSNGLWFDAACVADPNDPINNYICQKEKGSFLNFVLDLE